MNDGIVNCLKYIDSYWDKIICQPAQSKKTPHGISLPHAYITPNQDRSPYLFYWDSHFMFKGLIGTKRETVTKDVVENFAYLFRSFGLIPNLNAQYALDRSQPPFLSSMILDAYRVFNDKKWLKEMTDIAKEEYKNVWLDKKGVYHHSVKGSVLSRYGDCDLGYPLTSELESGWDFTTRFYGRCDEFLPVDLNSYLYKYERDFVYVAEIFKNHKEASFWKRKAQKRTREIIKLMWDEEEGFFFDFNYFTRKRSEFLSLAGFTPLWAGLATKDQAKRMVKKLPEFETPYGLAITSKSSLIGKINLAKIPNVCLPAIKPLLEPKQWDWPNIWAPLEYLTVVGLLNYGFLEDARQIMKKSIAAQTKVFQTYQTLFERIDGETGGKPKSYQYPLQTGFGWTNAVFYRYVKILEKIKN